MTDEKMRRREAELEIGQALVAALRDYELIGGQFTHMAGTIGAKALLARFPHFVEPAGEDQGTYDLLRDIVAETRCKPGWSFAIRKGEGALRLVITVPGVDSWDAEIPRTVSHWFPVPPATFNRRAWQRWIFECCRGVENHELGEWFQVGDARPFLPLHGPGEMPYVVVEYRDAVDARTTQDGSVREDGPRP